MGGSCARMTFLGSSPMDRVGPGESQGGVGNHGPGLCHAGPGTFGKADSSSIWVDFLRGKIVYIGGGTVKLHMGV